MYIPDISTVKRDYQMAQKNGTETASLEKPARKGKGIFCRISPVLHRKFTAFAKKQGRSFAAELEQAMARHLTEGAGVK